MANDKPESIEDYKKWLAKEHSLRITEATKTYYEQATMAAKQRFEASRFWVDLCDNLGEIEDEYLTRKAYRLFRSQDVEPHTKPFDSFLLKTFRRNVLENTDWPAPRVTGGCCLRTG